MDDRAADFNPSSKDLSAKQKLGTLLVGANALYYTKDLLLTVGSNKFYRVVQLFLINF